MLGKQFITYGQYPGCIREKALQLQPEPQDKKIEADVINVYPDFKYQVIEGFGGAITESTAYLLSQMDVGTRREALSRFFGKNGIHTKFIRTHIDSCDFSLGEYAAVSDPVSDPDLASFTLARDKKYIIPIIREAMEMADYELSVLLSPWSPPAAWKTPPMLSKNDMAVYGMIGLQVPDGSEPTRCFGGRLKPEHYGDWARYLVKYVQAYLDEGNPVTMLSIQNEENAVTVWDSCIWTAGEIKEFLKSHLYPQMKQAGLLDKIALFFWDHNKERVIERAAVVLDEQTDAMLGGIAFHWYSGDHFEAVSMLRQKYPDKTLMLSECCEMHAPGRNGALPMIPAPFKTYEAVDYEDAVHYAHDLIGNLNAGMNRWIDWNLVLDQNGGPRHVIGGCTAELIAAEDGSFRESMIYHYVAHFSRYILPGARRIGFSRCSDLFEMTAAENLDGSIVLVILNKSNADQKYYLRICGHLAELELPANTVSTVVLNHWFFKTGDKMFH